MPVILQRQAGGKAEAESHPSKGVTKEIDAGTNEMSQQVKMLAANPDDLIWIPRTHMIREQT